MNITCSAIHYNVFTKVKTAGNLFTPAFSSMGVGRKWKFSGHYECDVFTFCVPVHVLS